MKNWKNTAWASKVAVLCALVFLQGAAAAFEATSEADGSHTYFFASPALRVTSPTDLDLTGLNFIEVVAGGFRVSAQFLLEPLAGDAAWMPSASATWQGYDAPFREIILSANTIKLSGQISAERIFVDAPVALPGGSINLGSGGELTVVGGRDIDVGGIAPRPGSILSGQISAERIFVVALAALPGGCINLGSGGELTVVGGRDIDVGGEITPRPGSILLVPEPSTGVLMALGLVALLGFLPRRRDLTLGAMDTI